MSRYLQTDQHGIDHLEAAGFGVWEWDLVTHRVHYSKKWKSMLGYACDEIGETFAEFQDCVHPDDIAELLAKLNQHLEGLTPIFAQTFRMRAKDQSYRWIVSQGSVMARDENGKPLRLLGTHTDITESKQALIELETQKNFINKVVNSAPILVYIFDLETQQNVYCNETVFGILGYTPAEIQAHGKNLFDLLNFHNDDLVKVQRHYTELAQLPDGEVRTIDYRVEHKSGDYLMFRSHETAFKRNEMGQVTQILGTAVDITELQESEVQLAFLAHHDPLTGLMNRTLLHSRLEHAMQLCKREETLVAVCFIDLDDFKYINDRYGHAMGDRVLIEIASRLKKRVREEDSLSRIGGDEFVVVIESLPDEQTAQIIFNDFLQVFEAPIVIDKTEFSLSISMGISFFPQHGTTIDRLNRNADTAMYRAKQMGKNAFQVYKESMSKDLVGRLELEADLKMAITHNQFELHYQPKVNLKSSKVVGFEALIRWNHPTKGLIRPDHFIPLAEELGCIVPIGEWVLEQACRDLLTLQDDAHFYGTIAVNVSGVQLENGEFIKTVEAIFDQLEITPQDIELEITESAIMNNPMRWINLLAQLRFMGFKISIDDFGTGYSSLSYLKKLPVNQLKIDKSFVDDLTFDEEDSVIVSAVISLASAMHMGCVAEGIETQAQLAKLIEMGCEQGQGYLFSKPLPVQEVKAWLLDINSVQNLTPI
ncbi:MAG: EAL domain-containing protein [Thiotrichales bacterium]|nr:EAL domain-containing protein [Thiotrichales bacterium]